MRIWAIGDLHLSMDPRVEKPMDIFGGSWVGHEERLKEIWLRLDEALADLQWISALPGEKLILKGNHDLWWSGISKVKYACRDLPGLHFLQHDAFAWGGAVIFGTRGWTCPGAKDFTEEEDGAIYRREVLRLQMSADEAVRLAERMGAETGRKPEMIGVLHYPPTNDKFEPSGFTEIFEAVGVQNVYYGHLHGQNAYKNGLQGTFNGIEYSLISLDRLECCPKLIYEEGDNK